MSDVNVAVRQATEQVVRSRRFVTRAVDLREPGKPGYVLGASSPELARLVKQCDLLKNDATWMLDQIGIRRGWWTIDIGCGPLGITDLLAERAGAAGEVIGLERDPAMLELGHTLMAQRGLDTVRLIQGDARDTGMPAESFDFAHARLVLVNLPQPEEVVAEMVNITRPGGYVGCEEVDWVSWACDPIHPAWTRLVTINADIWRKRGMDVNVGRKLPRLLAQAGLTDIQTRAHAAVYNYKDDYQYLLLAFSEINRAEMIQSGYVTEAEYVEMTESLRRHLDNPTTFVTQSLFCQVWGRKPAGLKAA